MLHELTLTVYRRSSVHQLSKLSFLAACLHTISPAGMFLSAPYAESPFSLLNLAGCYLYAKAKTSVRAQNSKGDALIIFSGILFGVGTTFRGNGLFSGLILIYDAVSSMSKIVHSTNIQANVRKLFVVCLSGVLMACIAVLPQFLAYKEYCTNVSAEKPRRPWCSNWVPSIYAWVQKEYWYGWASGIVSGYTDILQGSRFSEVLDIIQPSIIPSCRANALHAIAVRLLGLES